MRKYASVALGILLTFSGCSNQTKVIIPELYRLQELPAIDTQEHRRREEKTRRERIWRSWEDLEEKVKPYVSRRDTYV